jgi:hypothetical protein
VKFRVEAVSKFRVDFNDVYGVDFDHIDVNLIDASFVSLPLMRGVPVDVSDESGHSCRGFVERIKMDRGRIIGAEVQLDLTSWHAKSELDLLYRNNAALQVDYVPAA